MFGSVARDLFDTVTGTLELRYASDKIGNDNPGARASLPLIENTFKTWSPRATLEWKYADDRMIYGSVSQGNKPGFINANPLLDPSLRFAEEEESLNFEVGTKNTLNDGRTTLNVAVYFIDWTKQQLTTTGLLSDGRPVSYVYNAGETEAKGLELEVAHVFSDQFTAGLGYALNDTSFVEMNEYSEQARFTGGDPSVAGNQTPNSSRHQANAFARYEWAGWRQPGLHPGGLFIRQPQVRADLQSRAQRRSEPDQPEAGHGHRAVATGPVRAQPDGRPHAYDSHPVRGLQEHPAARRQRPHLRVRARLPVPDGRPAPDRSHRNVRLLTPGKRALRFRLLFAPFFRETHEYVPVACSGILPPILPEEGSKEKATGVPFSGGSYRSASLSPLFVPLLVGTLEHGQRESSQDGASNEEGDEQRARKH